MAITLLKLTEERDCTNFMSSKKERESEGDLLCRRYFVEEGEVPFVVSQVVETEGLSLPKSWTNLD